MLCKELQYVQDCLTERLKVLELSRVSHSPAEVTWQSYNTPKTSEEQVGVDSWV